MCFTLGSWCKFQIRLTRVQDTTQWLDREVECEFIVKIGQSFGFEIEVDHPIPVTLIPNFATLNNSAKSKMNRLIGH